MECGQREHHHPGNAPIVEKIFPLKKWLTGNISELDNSWPDNIDHLKPELNIFC